MKSKKWTWILAVSALLLSSMGVAAILHPELSEKVISQVSGFYDDVLALGSPEKKKTAQNNAMKPESAADNKLETNPFTATSGSSVMTLAGLAGVAAATGGVAGPTGGVATGASGLAV